jgi:hypothetical protein
MALAVDVTPTAAGGSVWTDDFNRAGTDPGAGLGSIPGGPRWQVVSGSWQVSLGRPICSTPIAQNPIVVVYTGVNDADVEATLGGGDAIYLRVADAQNWERVRLDELTPYPKRSWKLYLESSVAGVVTSRGTADLGTTRPGRVRFTATGTALRVYLNDLTGAQLSATSTANRSAVWHGIGRGPSHSDDTFLTAVVIDTLNSPPYAPTLASPVAGAKIDHSAVQRFSWTHRDPNSNDPQSAFDLQYRLTGTLAWTSVSGTTTGGYHDFPAGTFNAGNYEWQARTYDSRGRVGAWSTSAFFTATGAPAAASILYPVNGATVGTAGVEVTWAVAAQEAYELARVPASADGTTALVSQPYLTTGAVLSASARSGLLELPVNNHVEFVALRVRVNGVWSGWATSRILVSYTAPLKPGIWADGDPVTGTINVTVTHPLPPTSVPQAVSCDYQRRILHLDGIPGDTSTIVTVAAAVPAGAGLIDYDVASAVEYDYRVIVHGSNGTTTTSAWASEYVPPPAVQVGPGFAGGLLAGLGASTPAGRGLHGGLTVGLGPRPITSTKTSSTSGGTDG